MHSPTKEHQVLLKDEHGKILIEIYLLIGNNSTWYSSVIQNNRTGAISTATYKKYKTAEKYFYQGVGRLFQRSQLTGRTLHWLF